MAWPMPKGAEKLNDEVCQAHRDGYHLNLVPTCPLCQKEKEEADHNKD